MNSVYIFYIIIITTITITTTTTTTTTTIKVINYCTTYYEPEQHYRINKH